jgi:protein phosphatase 1 regulatory subunit 7
MLELGSNKIKEIENLEGVSNIRSLFLGKNRIAEIKNLECLVNLEQIALGPNKLSEINQGLICLKNKLKELYLQ